MTVSPLTENNVACNSTCCEMHVTLAGVEASWGSALQRISMYVPVSPVCTCMLGCDVALHTRKSILGTMWAHSPACTMDNSPYLDAGPKAYFARLLQLPFALSDLYEGLSGARLQQAVAVALRLEPFKLSEQWCLASECLVWME